MANVQVQSPREFTIQIRHFTSNAIVGTGFVVSDNGLAITCAHVVQAATDNSGCQKGLAMSAYFAKSKKMWWAEVIGCFEGFDDDVALLQLRDEDGSFYLPDLMRPAKVGYADESAGNRFRSYGYRPLDIYKSGLAEGKILGDVEPPNGYVLQLDPIQLESSQINSGMSGAAVLDLERDRVVGIVSETWFPDATGKDRDTAWAVNVRVLALPPISLPMSDENALTETDIVTIATAPMTDNIAMPTLKEKLVNAPPIFDEWVGRVELLQALNEDWVDPARRIVELIGFGGEGKSSVARRWVANVLSSENKPQGVFWWGFESNPSIDKFFEELLKFLVDGINTQALPSAAEKIQVINAMLSNSRCIFVLDGLEVLQYDDGEDYGLLKNSLLREWLRDFAKVEHNSFAILTSRLPVFDLLDFTTFVHREVKSLNVKEGEELLTKVGVKGSLLAIRSVAANWDGYALILSTIGAYLVDRYGGDVQHIRDIPPPTSNETRYQQVRRVLHFYDAHLTAAEREFLQTCSAFRIPVPDRSFKRLFRSWDGIERSPEIPERQYQPNFIERSIIWVLWLIDRILQTKRSKWIRVRGRLDKPMASLDSKTFSAMVNRLVDYRMLRHNQQENCYTIHPLLREYFQQVLREQPEQQRQIHHRLKDFYLSISPPVLQLPTLDSLAPLIEAVHHACQAGEYDEAIDIFAERILQKRKFVLLSDLHAYETNLAILRDFFPQGDTSQDPRVSRLTTKAFILNTSARSLMSLGCLTEAHTLYKRSTKIHLAESDWNNAISDYEGFLDLSNYMGDPVSIIKSAHELIPLSERTQNKLYKTLALSAIAYAAFLQGDGTTAGETFQQAEALECEINPSQQYLYSNRGIFHAEYLLRYGESDYARHVTDANLSFDVGYASPSNASRSHRVLGDLGIDPQVHYTEALKIARSISLRHVLITALLGYGRWLVGLGLISISQEVVQAISHSQTEQCYMLSLRTNENPRDENDLVLARQYLHEALTYATTSGYRIYETDLRIALAWLHWREGDLVTARREADRAKRASEEMGYFWGRVDAASFFVHIDEPTT
ncbi:trypsin-like peptidase domain-containing protein (plasmid) [Pseudanabaena biceps]|nr:trypsin-like peptidase domain-containing protein [Pseudanabaena biceps]